MSCGVVYSPTIGASGEERDHFHSLSSASLFSAGDGSSNEFTAPTFSIGTSLNMSGSSTGLKKISQPNQPTWSYFFTLGSPNTRHFCQAGDRLAARSKRSID